MSDIILFLFLYFLLPYINLINFCFMTGEFLRTQELEAKNLEVRSQPGMASIPFLGFFSNKNFL